jgi:tetratricopeptide (TPR) repeat protein/anti-sigma regulatory factor (Ser/Thr protein kinase)
MKTGRSYIKTGITLFLLIFVSTYSLYSSGNQSFSFLRKVKKVSPDTSEVNIHIMKALEYAYHSKKVDLVKAHIDSAETICIEKNIEFPTLLHLARAEYFFITSDFRNASQEGTLAMNKAKANNDKQIIANALNFFGRYSFRTGFYFESVDYFKSCIDIAKKNKIKILVPWSYLSLANLYLTIGDMKEMQNSLYSMIEASIADKDTVFLAMGYYRLGSSYTEKVRDYLKADSLLKKCLELALIRSDSNYAALSLANLGWNSYLDRKYNDGIEFYKRSLSYSLPANMHGHAANAYGNLGTIYRDLGETEKALANYQKSIDHAKVINDLYNLQWVYSDMSELFLRKRDTSNAYKTFVMFKKFSDEQIKKSSTQGLSDARIRYEADTRNKEVELLSLRLRNHELIIYGSAGLFLLSLAIFILILSRAKINNKRRISEMNHKIAEVTQANLRQQMNPHFIFNTLNSIQYYMYQHDKLATNNYLTKFSSLMRKVLENSQHTSVPLSDELDALKLYLDLEIIRFKDKFTYEINVDEEIDTLLYKVPTMLIQPYVENSICHGLIPADNKGSIKIDLKLKDDYISCTIEDNGIGREAAMVKRNKSENNHNSLGTQIVASRLDLVNALYGTTLKTIYTDLKNETGESEGTRVEIQIPILS